MIKYYLFLTIFFASAIHAQTYTSYFTGDTTDVMTSPQKGVVLMGGAGEEENAMKWFLQRADGGDILILRTDDSDGYNDYLFSDLGVDVNSVETIVCNSAIASSEDYVINQIKNAEAVWFAGGDQWNYLSYWRDTEMEDAINYCVNEKGITIGGISAGMAIQGEIIFSAENGSVTSFQALSNPYGTLMTLAYDDFIENPLMENIITDTHFDDPDRRGRTTAFLARILNDYGFNGYAIGCNEYTAVCIDENKIAYAFGDYPDYEDYVYFVQINCIEPNEPEVIEAGDQLTWNRNNAALKVIKMSATETGSASLDLNDWKTVTGLYTWENWWVEDGAFFIAEETTAIDCEVAIDPDLYQDNNIGIIIYPNPANNFLQLEILNQGYSGNVIIKNIIGEHICIAAAQNGQLNVAHLNAGIYIVELQQNNQMLKTFFIKQ